MNLKEKIEAIKKIKALMDTMPHRSNEQSIQVLSICLAGFQHQLPSQPHLASLHVKKPFYMSLNPYFLESWLHATAEQEKHIQQQLKRKVDKYSFTRSKVKTTQINLLIHQAAVTQSSQTTPKYIHTKFNKTKLKDTPFDIFKKNACIDTPIRHLSEMSLDINTCANHTHATDLALSSHPHHAYTLLACSDVLAIPLIPISEATASSQTPILVLKERHQFRLIHGVERLRLAQLFHQTHVNALIIERQDGFSWQSLRHYIDQTPSSINVHQLYLALTQDMHHST